MENKEKKIELGSGNFPASIENTNLMEFEGIQMHALLSEYSEKKGNKDKLSPISSPRVKNVILLAQEQRDLKAKHDEARKQLSLTKDRNRQAILENEITKYTEKNNKLADEIHETTKNYSRDELAQAEEEQKQTEYRKVSPQLTQEIYDLKKKIVTFFLTWKGYKNIEEILTNSTAKQTNRLIAEIIKNPENELLQDFFPLSISGEDQSQGMEK